MQHKTISGLLTSLIWFYGFYAFFILLEIFYFLSLLYYRDENELIFSMAHVGFFMTEMIICLVYTALWVHWKDKTEITETLLYIVAISLLLRLGLIYYLYIFTNPNAEIQIPYLYKQAYSNSGGARIFFPLFQVILHGFLAGTMMQRFFKKGKM